MMTYRGDDIASWAVHPVVDAFLIHRVKVERECNHVVGHIFGDGLLDEDDLLICVGLPEVHPFALSLPGRSDKDLGD